MIKPHIVKYLDRIKFVVSTIKEQTQSEIGQDTSRRETVGEVDSLMPRPPIDLSNPSEMGDNMNSPTYLTELNTPSPSRFSGDYASQSPEMFPLFMRFPKTIAQEAAQNPVDAPQTNYPQSASPIPRTSAQGYASEMKRRKNNNSGN